MRRHIATTIAIVLAATLITGCEEPTAEEQAAAAASSEAKAADREAKKQEKEQQKADREAEKQRKKEEKEAKKQAEEDARENAGKHIEEWWLTTADAESWQDIGDQYPWAWEGHVLTMDSNDNTLIVVTNLADTEDGRSIAKSAMQGIQNNTNFNADEFPEEIHDYLKYIQVFDLQGTLLANGSLDFGE